MAIAVVAGWFASDVVCCDEDVVWFIVACHQPVFATTKGTETSIKQPRALRKKLSLALEANFAPHLAAYIELMDMSAVTKCQPREKIANATNGHLQLPGPHALPAQTLPTLHMR